MPHGVRPPYPFCQKPSSVREIHSTKNYIIAQRTDTFKRIFQTKKYVKTTKSPQKCKNEVLTTKKHSFFENIGAAWCARALQLLSETKFGSRNTFYTKNIHCVTNPHFETHIPIKKYVKTAQNTKK